jgi:hypothetical protein
LAIFTNEVFIKQGLELMGVSDTQYDKIELYKFFGWMAGSFTLLLLVKSFSFKKIIVFCIFLYWLSVFNIIFIDVSYEITLLYFPLYSGTIIMMSALLLGYILSDSRVGNSYSIFMYSASILVAFLLSEFFEYISFDNTRTAWTTLITLNILLIGAFLSILMVSNAYAYKIDLEESRFFPVLRHSELEILVVFSVFYCIIIMIYGYNIYAMADSLFTFEPTIKKYFRLTAIAVAIILARFYIPRFKRKHEINILCIMTLMLLFVSIDSWGRSLVFTIIGRTGLIAASYILLTNSLLLLADKFSGINLFNALALYVVGATFGCYCGYITIDVEETILGPRGFLISICFVLLGLLLYYLYFFRKYKLYR